MLLRIIDSSSPNNNAIRILLEDGDDIIDFYVEDYSSPMTQSFFKSISWYFKEYIDVDQNVSDAASLAARLIKNGQFQGDALIGEDHQLIRCRDHIQTKGFQNLKVRFESGDPRFFNEMWEALVLPDSKYILSGVANSYVRKWIAQDIVPEFPDLKFDLPNYADGDNPTAKGIKPLKILHVVSRPDMPELVECPSNSVGMAMSALCGNVIDYVVVAPESVLQLKDVLASTPVHIVHYDGPIVVTDGMPYIVIADANRVSHLLDVRELSICLSENKIGVLCIDACAYISSNNMIPAAQGLAHLAYIAHKHGIGNVIGMGQVTNPWISGECYKTLYEQIAKGFPLHQAVVEARKALQACTEIDLTSIDSMPFMYWPLLVHYSQQSIEFFTSAQSRVGFGEIERLTAFRAKMFGFRYSLLPPLAERIGDGLFLSVVNCLKRPKSSSLGYCAFLRGDPGIGKTALAHAIALYLSEKEAIDFAFYFSYADDFYSVTDICKMITPVLELSSDSISSIKNKLADSHCLFVFDDFSSSETHSDEYVMLENFISMLMEIDQSILVIGNSSFVEPTELSNSITVAPLSSLEQKILCVKLMRELGTHFTLHQISPVLAVLNGNPWLIKKVIPLLTEDNIDTLATDLMVHISDHGEDESKLNRFYDWQWSLLAPVWQRLLILCSDVHGLLLEMVMVAVDGTQDVGSFKDLFLCLGDEEANITSGLSSLERAGFIVRLPHARLVDQKCLEFLKKQRYESFRDLDIRFIDSKFSKLLCEGITILSRHLIKKPNPAIYENLLFNRRHWVKHFENIWFNQEYKSFFSVKFAFSQLMDQAGLANELKQWSADLLDRSTVINSESKTDAAMAWLALASEVVSDVEYIDEKVFLESVSLWRKWLDEFIADDNRSDLALFHQVVNYLETFHKTKKDFSTCVAIQERAFPIYIEHKSWVKAIHSLKCLAGYYSNLENLERALNAERIIIEQVPYSEFPAGFYLQQLIDILILRVKRKDVGHAQELITKAKAMDVDNHFINILDGVQCDIDYLSGNYPAALAHYCRLWAQALGTEHVEYIKSLQQRLIELEQHIDPGTYNAVFEREVPKGTVRPAEYQVPQIS